MSPYFPRKTSSLGATYHSCLPTSVVDQREIFGLIREGFKKNPGLAYLIMTHDEEQHFSLTKIETYPRMTSALDL